MSSKEILDWLNSNKACPYFNDPPVGDDDLELVAPHWVFCEYEDRCLDKDSCPILPDCPMFPRIAKSA